MEARNVATSTDMDTPTTHTGEQAHLPIIDLSGDDEARIARKLLEAAAEWGFVYVRGRGLDIDAARIKGVFNLVSSLLAPRIRLRLYMTDVDTATVPEVLRLLCLGEGEMPDRARSRQPPLQSSRPVRHT